MRMPAAYGSRTISVDGISISTTDNWAGAITSLTWDNQEFVLNRGAGASWQSAAQFGATTPQQGECYNPTEMGSVGPWTRSSSQLIATGGYENEIITLSRMAFWYPPGHIPPGLCNNTLTSSEMTVDNSNFRHWKKVTIEEGQVINYETQFLDVPVHVGFNQFEAVTGYIPLNKNPKDFTRVYRWINGVLTSYYFEEISQTPYPVILVSQDGTTAMGIRTYPVSPGVGYYDDKVPYIVVSKKPDPNLTIQESIKWAAVYRRDCRNKAGCTLGAGAYSFNTRIVIGTLAHVISKMPTL
ncbi:MAG: hypothetical protein SGJ18_07560 [Pseudomonadota bacterium]|nr:hypothetical protein [Pseudomonadota bacterium]